MTSLSAQAVVSGAKFGPVNFEKKINEVLKLID